MKVIRYKNSNKGDSIFDESLLGVNHFVVGYTDYTLCGHATDEYDYDIKQIVTCPICIRIIKECEQAKYRIKKEGEN